MWASPVALGEGVVGEGEGEGVVGESLADGRGLAFLLGKDVAVRAGLGAAVRSDADALGCMFLAGVRVRPSSMPEGMGMTEMLELGQPATSEDVEVNAPPTRMATQARARVPPSTTTIMMLRLRRPL